MASPKISLRFWLVVPFVLQIAATVGLVGYLSFKNGQEAINEISSQLRQEISDRIQQQLTNYIEAPFLVNGINAIALKDGNLDLTQPAKPDFFWNQTKSLPSTSLIYCGRQSDGAFMGVGRDISAQTPKLQVVFSGPATGGYMNYIDIDTQGKPAALEQRVIRKYNPKVRPWYVKAQKTRQANWSDIYLDFDSLVPVITASQPVYDHNQQLLGVCATDFILSVELDAFLNRLKIGKTGETFIIERSGLLISSSTSNEEALLVGEGANVQRLRATQSHNRLVRETAHHLVKTFGDLHQIQSAQQFSFTSQGKQLVQISPFQDQHGLDWLIVVVVPEADFMERIHTGTYITVLLCFIALIVATRIGVLTAHHITSPLLQLNQAAKRIAAGDWGHTINVVQNNEVGELARSFNQMVNQLKIGFAEKQELNQALTHKQTQLSQILEALPIGVAVLRPAEASNENYLNAAGQRLLGIEVGTEAQTALLPEQIVQTYQIYQAGTQHLYLPEKLPILRALQGEIASADDLEIRRSDGQTIMLETWATPAFDEAGNVVYAIATFQDITNRKWVDQLLEEYNQSLERDVHDRTLALEQEILERKQIEAALRQSELQNQAIVSAIPDLIFSTSAEGQILSYSHRTAPFNDLIPKTIDPTGKLLSDLIAPEVATRHLQYIHQALATGKLETYEQQVVIDDKLQYEEVRVIPNGDDRVLFIIRDINDRKQAEIVLQQAKEAAEAANRAKSTFLASMSHELRTPLNAILGFAQIMQRDPNMSSEQKRNLEIINRSGEHLLELINSVLDLSKIEAGHLERLDSNFDLYKLIQTVDAMLQVRAVAKGIQLQVEVLPEVPHFVITDPGKLRQVLINLIGNAIKFTDQGSVTLRVKRGNPEAIIVSEEKLEDPFTSFDVLHFEVQDTGMGIAAADIDRIFAAFEQTSSGKKLTEGTGLGLTLSQKFVNLMEGKISVNSTPGLGSTFEFDILVRLGESPVAQSRVLERPVIGLAPHQPSYRILVVDDQPENRDLLVQLLEPVGFSVQVAAHGEEAITLWQKWQPHLILMDIRMPIMNGIQATAHIRQQEQSCTLSSPHTQIIALSASVFHQDRLRALSAACDGFLKKPFRVNELFEKLATHLQLTYIYADVEPLPLQETDETEFASTRQLLPSGQVEHLCQAAESGDDVAIFQLLDQLPDEHHAFVVKLRHLAQRYEFDRILSLLTGNSSQ